MIDFEQETIDQGKKLARIEEVLGSIKNSIQKLEVDPSKYVSCKIFIFSMGVVASSMSYLFFKTM